MTRGSEEYLFELVERTYEETHKNHLMLEQIINVIYTYLANHSRENEEDFNRNVLANIIGNLFDIGKTNIKSY